MLARSIHTVQPKIDPFKHLVNIPMVQSSYYATLQDKASSDSLSLGKVSLESLYDLPQGQQLVELRMAKVPKSATGLLQGPAHKSYSLRRIWIPQIEHFSQILQ